MNTGQIVKSKSTERFTVIPNSILEDRRLTLRAIGLLCYILRLPPDWILHKSRLHNNLNEGRDAVINAFNELEKFGYIEKNEVREAGKFKGFNYIVYDIPQIVVPFTDKPKPEKAEPVPKPEKPKSTKPISEKPTLLNTDSTKEFPLSSTNVDNKGAASSKPKSTQQKFIDIYFNWFKNQNEGAPPKMDGAAGNAAKSLIGYFKQIVKARADLEKITLDSEQEENRLLEGWQLVLNSWENLEPFYQDKTRLIDINSNIQNIYNYLKNGKRFIKNNQNGHSKKINGSDVRDMFAEIDKRHGL